MRKPKLTDEQIVALLREAERGENTIAEICKKAGISEQTFYRWGNKFAGNTVQDVRKLKQLEKDNARLLRPPGRGWRSSGWSGSIQHEGTCPGLPRWFAPPSRSAGQWEWFPRPGQQNGPGGHRKSQRGSSQIVSPGPSRPMVGRPATCLHVEGRPPIGREARSASASAASRAWAAWVGAPSPGSRVMRKPLP